MTTDTKAKQKKEDGTITRKIVFTNYRNLGIGKPQSLTINCRANKNSLGELIIVIGGNNIGKTNVLDGIGALKNGIDADRDKPDFIYKEDIDTNIKLTVCNGKTWAYARDAKVKTVFENTTPIPPKSMPKSFEYKMSQELSHFLINYQFQQTRQSIEKRQVLSNDMYTTLINGVNQSYGYAMQNYDVDNSLARLGRMLLKEIEDYNKTVKEYQRAVEECKNYDKIINEMNEKVLEETGCSLVPNIVQYKEEQISQSDMSAKITNLVKSPFFTKVFNLLGIKPNEILTCCERVNSNKISSGALTKLEQEMNAKLEILSKQFNKMYTFDNNEYKFAFRLETEKVLFSISYGGTPLNIDRQSTGFRWFFNFYINLLNDEKLGNGDIVLMDEPATHLHVRGVVELRDFLKKYAKKSGISFILSTHSPFLIDADYLDELRIVKRNEENATICNDFTLGKEETRDTLFDVLGSLTVGRHVVLNPNDPLVFVEGVTDYNYLVAFKKYITNKNKDEFCINFLPVNGLKDNNLISKLCSIVKNPTLLVDNDEAGTITERKNKNSGAKIALIKLSEVDEGIKTIEDMFVGKDRELVAEKFNSNSRHFKNNFDDIVKQLSPETIKNFEKLFNIIMLQ